MRRLVLLRKNGIFETQKAEVRSQEADCRLFDFQVQNQAMTPGLKTSGS